MVKMQSEKSIVEAGEVLEISRRRRIIAPRKLKSETTGHTEWSSRSRHNKAEILITIDLEIKAGLGTEVEVLGTRTQEADTRDNEVGIVMLDAIAATGLVTKIIGTGT